MADIASVTPHRAVLLIAKIEADTRQALVDHLLNLATRVSLGELGSVSVSGGVSSGHVIQFTESQTPTHDQYFDALKRHLAAVAKADANG